MFDRQPEPNVSTGPFIEDDEPEGVLPRDQAVLDAIQQEGLTIFTFDGLRRLLRIHQETLSRTIDRLEEQGLVEKVAEGYRIVDGRDPIPSQVGLSSQNRPLVQTLLPPDVNVKTIVAGLKGRWFGTLRWVGYSRTDDATVLKWITDEDGTQLDARFSDNLLTIEARVEDGKEAPDAINASYQLLAHISRLYRKPAMRRGRNLFATVAYHPAMDYPDFSFA